MPDNGALEPQIGMNKTRAYLLHVVSVSPHERSFMDLCHSFSFQMSFFNFYHSSLGTCDGCDSCWTAVIINTEMQNPDTTANALLPAFVVWEAAGVCDLTAHCSGATGPGYRVTTHTHMVARVFVLV